MPTFIRKEPFELSGDLRANKKVSKRLLEQNTVSGFLGPTKNRSEDFDKLDKVLEELEIQVEAFFPSFYRAFGADFQVEPNNPTRAYYNLEKAKRFVEKQSFSLKQLPLDDINSVKKYIDIFTTLKRKADDGLDQIERARRVPEPNNLDYDLSEGSRQILDKISILLEEIINPLQAQVDIYSSGVVQRDLTGGGNCSCKWDLDEPLRNNPMYQTQKYIF